MDISVIIVNWNTKELLLECLRSLAMQAGDFKKEVIVVDNGSTDGSPRTVRATFPDIKVIENNANLGFAKANNIGIAKSHGRYVCLLNSDVRALDSCLLQLINFMDENPDIGISGPKILNPDLTIQDSCRKFPSLWNNLSPAIGLDKIFRNVPFFSGEHMFHFKHDTMLHVDYLAGCFLMVRRKALDEVGLLDERFFIYQEEVDWCKRFRNQGWKVSFFPEAAAVHNHGASSSKEPVRFALAREKAVLQYWEKHYGPFSVMAIWSILFLNHALRIIPRLALYCVRGTHRFRLGQKIRMDLVCLSALLRPQASTQG
jgi:hypothetical protein